MIPIELGKESAGRFECHFISGGVVHRLKSRQPLLDAARELKRMGADTGQQIGLFRPGREAPDLTSTVGAAAELTVKELRKGGAPYFTKYQPYQGDSHDKDSLD